MVPLPPVPHLGVAVLPQLLPQLRAELAVLHRRLVQAGAPAGVDLQAARELHEAPQRDGHLGVASLSDRGLKHYS